MPLCNDYYLRPVWRQDQPLFPQEPMTMRQAIREGEALARSGVRLVIRNRDDHVVATGRAILSGQVRA